MPPVDNQQQRKPVEGEDLDLIDNSLEDEGKDESELWNEIDAEEEGAAASSDDGQPATEDDEKSQAAGDDDEQFTDDDAAAAAGDDDKSGNSAEAGTGDNAQAGDDKKDGQQAADDIWANASDEQRAAFEAAQQHLEKLQQSERSQRGRLSVMQRQLNEIQRSQQSGHQQQAAPDKDGAAGKQEGQEGQQGQGKQDDGAEGDFTGSDEWKSFAEDYPEVSGPIGKMIGKLEEKVTRQEKELSAIGSERRQSAMDEQQQLLEQEHSDWSTVVDTNADAFSEWINSQPRHIREAAQRNAEAIVDAEEAADVIGRFKTHIGIQSQQGGGNANQQQQNNGQQGGKPGGGNDNSQQPAMSGKRRQQLASASSARSRAPGPSQGIPEDGDDEELWKAWDQAEARQQAAGG